MNTSVQFILDQGQPVWAVMPYDFYLQLADEAEMLADIRDYDAVKQAIERGEEELTPAGIIFDLLDGKNPIKVWREFRGLTQQQLATAAGITPAYLSQLEHNKRTGKPELLLAIANALQLSLDDLVF